MRIHWMIRLYPHAWRERYEAEFMAVLDQYEPTMLTFLDITINAFNAHVDPTSWDERSFHPMDIFKRMGRSTGTIFLAFMAMLLSYVIFLSSLGDIFDWTIRHNSFTDFMSRHVSGLMDLQLATLLIAMLLVTSAFAFQKGSTSSKIWKFIPFILVLFPIVNAIFYFGCTYLHGAICRLDWGWGNLIYLSLIFIVPLIAIVLFKNQINPRILKISWLALAVVVFGMLVLIAETLTWGILVWSTSQQMVIRLAQGYDRELLPGDYHIWLGIGLVLVVFFGGAAVAALIHGMPAWRTRNERLQPPENARTA